MKTASPCSVIRGKRYCNRYHFQERENVDFLIYEGPTDPTITGSFGNIFRYKNFRLNIFLTYSFGNKIRLDPVFSNKYTDLTAMPKEYKKPLGYPWRRSYN